MANTLMTSPAQTPQPAAQPAARSCYQLGVCQARKPACEGCTWQLAPGTVQGPYRRALLRRMATPAQWHELRRLLLASAIAATVVGVASVVVGYLVGRAI